ncbi:MAG: hypothetical protein KIT10_11220 [Flavobacteriales bacterium]|nr:hypothetical protein [Flavobacteriales bacterium]
MSRRPFILPPWALLALVLVGTGCSQQKDAFLNRTFHRLTARDNGWFNANEKLNEVVASMEDAYVDDFDHVLPLFIYGTDEQAKSAIPDLEKCIEKCSLVIERHSMDIGGDERNTWIDDAWFVIGKSQFYKKNYYEADRVFGFVARRYKGENRQWESQVWQARTAIQLEQYAKAQSALDKVKAEKKLPKRFDHGELAAVQADLDLKRNKLEDAIMNLEAAIPNARRKRERVRWSFILAQLYEQKGDEEKAIRQYAAVTRMSPPYELAFHAQIFQAFAFSRGNSKLLRQKLHKMLRDEKHVDHYDMIHYALADLDLKERNKPGAIEHLETSARVSTTDTKQKAKTWLKLADLYFDDRIYASAQVYYDSTRTLMDEQHPRFREVDTRAEVLGELVEHLAIIALEDSLQALAALDEKELEKRIRVMIRERERAEEEKERLEAEARERPQDTPAGRAAPPAGGGTGRGVWYFYDPQQIGRGASQFRKTWGNRKLEDDWRRKDRSGSAMADRKEDPEELADGGKGADKGQEAWRDPAFYTKDLPRDEEALSASNERICASMYASGMIYKEQLKDVDNAIESFEMLYNRFDYCRYTPESYYQLYRIYLEKEQAANYFSPDGSGSQLFANIILDRYPDSEFARLVRDPNILQADEARRVAEEAAYKASYQDYREYAYGKVIAECVRVIEGEPHNHYRVKYYMLRAMAIGGMRDAEGFRLALAEIKALFPGTDEATAAENLLAILDQGVSMPAPKKAGGNYKPEQGKHYFAIIVPNAGNDMVAIKNKLADFNSTFFRQAGIEITNNFLDPETQVVLVSFFDTKAKAMEFYNLYKGNRDILRGINDMGFPAFAISPGNYSQLYKHKDVDAYSAFFASNYLGGK